VRPLDEIDTDLELPLSSATSWGSGVPAARLQGALGRTRRAVLYEPPGALPADQHVRCRSGDDGLPTNERRRQAQLTAFCMAPNGSATTSRTRTRRLREPRPTDVIGSGSSSSFSILPDLETRSAA
jgi:hypothetical protein